MAVMEHPDMPNSMLGIQGLNPWNVLLVFVILGWLSARKREGLAWDMPRHINVLLVLYLVIVLIGFFRLMADQGTLAYYEMLVGNRPSTAIYLISENLINTVKWVIPGLLLFDGCNSRSRFTWGIASLLAIYFLLGIQVIKWMPLSTITSGGDLSERSAKITLNEIGYHRVNLSAMLAGASWAIFITITLVKKRSHALLIALSAAMVFFAQALTGGRAGYASWLLTGLTLSYLRWRKYLVLIPVMAILLVWVVPGVSERISSGFTEESRDSNRNIEKFNSRDSSIDLYTITSGRNIAWPYVIDEICDEPLFGHGRKAMQRTGISARLWEELGESFPHPHNAYLQWLLDNGLIGFVPVFVFYFLVMKYSFSLLRDFRSSLFITIGGITFSLFFAFLAASIGSQTFYPREGGVGMWCAMGLMFRVYLERSRLMTKEKNLSSTGIDKLFWEKK